ncbi:MAG: helix-turn-helix domain-containing protein [Candidatus Woesearchaeota archaeon]
MKQRELIDNTCLLLIKQGYAVKSMTRSCFDLLARQGRKILLIKAVEDAKSLDKETMDEMIKVADYLSGSPIIIAEKAGFILERNIVYSKHSIYTMNLDTFANSVMNRMPYIKSSKAGATVQLSGDMLRKKREELGYSLTELAARLGVSRNMVQRYESGNSEITIQRAVRMTDQLGKEVFRRIDIFSRHAPIIAHIPGKGDISKKYFTLGFDSEETKRSPFDIIARKKDRLILTGVGDKVNPNARKVSELLDADNLMIYKKKRPKDLPSMKKKEFLEIEKAKELMKFLKEF